MPMNIICSDDFILAIFLEEGKGESKFVAAIQIQTFQV